MLSLRWWVKREMWVHSAVIMRLGCVALHHLQLLPVFLHDGSTLGPIPTSTIGMAAQGKRFILK